MDDIKTLVDIVSTLVTTTAVVIGAAWAYFKFLKGRTFRPRLEVGLSGEWRPVDDGRHLFHARVTVTNIGAAVVELVSGEPVCRLAAAVTNRIPRRRSNSGSRTASSRFSRSTRGSSRVKLSPMTCSSIWHLSPRTC